MLILEKNEQIVLLLFTLNLGKIPQKLLCNKEVNVLRIPYLQLFPGYHCLA